MSGIALSIYCPETCKRVVNRHPWSTVCVKNILYLLSNGIASDRASSSSTYLLPKCGFFPFFGTASSSFCTLISSGTNLSMYSVFLIFFFLPQELEGQLRLEHI